MKNPWFPLYVADYLAKTSHLSQAQHGAYFLLMLHYYATGRPIPDDDASLQRICRAFAGEELMQTRSVLTMFFTLDGDCWRHDRIEEELHRSASISQSRRSAAAKKWGKSPLETSPVTVRGQRLAAGRKIGAHTQQEWLQLLEVLGSKCMKCGATDDIVKDHIEPVYSGGSDAIDNLQPLCRTCNSAKGPDTTDYRPKNWQEQWLSRCKSAAKSLQSQSQSQSQSEAEKERAVVVPDSSGTKKRPPQVEKPKPTPTETFHHPTQYAVRLCQELVIPAKGNIETIAEAIEILAKSRQSTFGEAYDHLLTKALAAKEAGETVNLFWFRDGKYNGPGQNRMAKLAALGRTEYDTSGNKALIDRIKQGKHW